jgi:hypothetical protein
MPLQATSGAASYDAFGGGVPVVPNYIEEVFSCTLYTGNTSTQTVTNGIDLSGKGGLVWAKARNTTFGHWWWDTARGVTKTLASQAPDGQYTFASSLTAFNNNGYSLGGSYYTEAWDFASWTFRKQPKFFDVVTYTGTGSNRTISHSLGSVPACIMVKRTDASGDWQVYHRSLANTEYLVLNDTVGKATGATRWNSTTPTSTVFSLGTDATVNASGGTYVAYIFAHDAGGFGLTGTDNVISCGTYTGTGAAGNNVTLGYEPQFLITKRTSNTGSWIMVDTMRGWVTPIVAKTNWLYPNTTAAEDVDYNYHSPTSTGFVLNTDDATVNGTGATYIYIAIRRGPMKVPTSGTSVFSPVARTGTSSTTTITSGFPIDLSLIKQTNTTDEQWNWSDRLRGRQNWLTTSLDNPTSPAEDTTNNTGSVTGFDSNTALLVGSNGMVNSSANTYANYFFKRAPSFFDSVCYEGTGSNQNITHNLGVAPELIIVKGRSNAQRWPVYSTPLYGATKAIFLNTTENVSTNTVYWNNTAPTSSVFRVGTSNMVNASATTYIAWLFATCAGVSKVGTYTGTGATLQIDCGFTSGARFVLIKAGGIASYVWNSASGIVSGNDPYLLMNTNAAEVTNTDYIDTYSAGFELTSTASTTVNISGGQYIFLAIA